MDYDVLEAKYVGGYVVWLRFSDGLDGEVDLQQTLKGPIFEPLRDLMVFRSFHIDANFKTLVWPGGADLAPEFLHDEVKRARTLSA